MLQRVVPERNVQTRMQEHGTHARFQSLMQSFHLPIPKVLSTCSCDYFTLSRPLQVIQSKRSIEIAFIIDLQLFGRSPQFGEQFGSAEQSLTFVTQSVTTANPPDLIAVK